MHKKQSKYFKNDLIPQNVLLYFVYGQLHVLFQNILNSKINYTTSFKRVTGRKTARPRVWL